MYIGIASFINLYKLSYFLERAFFFSPRVWKLNAIHREVCIDVILCVGM